MIAALQSELGFLSNPVGSHVQSAEMGNQALNSLALISARYCHTAIDVLSQLSAGHLLALCQAFDLRAMHISFLELLQPQLSSITSKILGPLLAYRDMLDSLQKALWKKLTKTLDDATTMNSPQRFNFVVESLQPNVLPSLRSSEDAILALKRWTKLCSESMLQSFQTNLDLYSARPDATPFLGHAGKKMYSFVRQTLGVPFLRAQHYRSPEPEPDLAYLMDEHGHSKSLAERDSVTPGSFLTTIYCAIRNGSLHVPVMECLREAQQ